MTESRKRDGRRGSPTPAAVLALVAAALTAVGASAVGLTRPQAEPTTSQTSPGGAYAARLVDRPVILGRSAPVRITIGDIGVDAGLEQLGRSADGRTIQLPRDSARAGWYENGATPGEAGPTIIVGYIASRRQRGVFGRLAALKIGAHVDVRRTDGAHVLYRVDEIATYPARFFPVAKAYGPTSTSTLRIVTCGGALRPGQQLGNSVVYGHQISVHR
ncbi:MAG TPA: sortase [Jatrophihabitantaceae bacterium]